MQADTVVQDNSTRMQVRRVLLITLILNLAVSAGKIIIGTLTGALSITADGFHSLMDGSSNILGLAANRIAGKPADEGHPYGHRRFETLAALAVGIVLLITGWEIIGGVIERLTNPEPPDISPLTFGVLIGTLAVNLFVSRYERREGERLRSELLIADAANTGADVFVTLSVLFSMIMVSFGFAWADPLAALIIVILIGRAAWQVIRQTGGVLVDAAPYKAARLARIAAEAPGVEKVRRVRSRGTVDAAHIDIDVEVNSATTAAQTAAITDAIRQRMQAELGGVEEVEVHFIPPEQPSTDYALTARARADALGLSTHEVHVRETPEGKVMEIHVEVPPGQTLGEAHDRVSEFEEAVRENLPDLSDVVTHIEPRPPEVIEHGEDSAAGDLTGRALRLLQAIFPAADWHDLRAAGSPEEGYVLSLHVGLDPQMTVEEAHQLAEEAETLLRSNYPLVNRVTIHTEPPDGELGDQA